MSDAASHGIGGRPDPLAGHERELEREKTEEQAARWAQALATHVVAQLPLPLPASETPGAWRQSDGVLTHAADPRANSVASSNAVQASPGEDASRVVMSVETPDLGRLSLVLERSDAGVRVVIGVADPAQAERMQSERDALARQLVGTGFRVESVRIVSQSEVGTVLAQSKPIARSLAFLNADEATQQEETKGRRRGSRKLNLVG